MFDPVASLESVQWRAGPAGIGHRIPQQQARASQISQGPPVQPGDDDMPCPRKFQPTGSGTCLERNQRIFVSMAHSCSTMLPFLWPLLSDFMAYTNKSQELPQRGDTGPWVADRKKQMDPLKSGCPRVTVERGTAISTPCSQERSLWKPMVGTSLSRVVPRLARVPWHCWNLGHPLETGDTRSAELCTNGNLC